MQTPVVTLGVLVAGMVAGVGAEELPVGYRELTPGTVRVWDTKIRYTHFYVDFEAWADRGKWMQVPYGKTDHVFEGEAVMENENVFLFLHSGKQSGPILYAKLGAGKHSIHNALYRVWWEEDGKVHHYDGQPRENRIEKNDTGEAVVGNSTTGKIGGKSNAGRYRLLAGKHWLEVSPVEGQKADEMGYHGEARVMLVPDYKDGNDHVFDSESDDNLWRTWGWNESAEQPVHPTRKVDTQVKKYGTYVMTPPGSRMLIDLQMTGGQFMWTMTYRSWNVAKPYLNWCEGGRLDRWPPWWEGDLKNDRQISRVWSAPYGCFGGEKIVVGAVNSPGSWHPEVVGTPLPGGKVAGRPVKPGETLTTQWKVPYAGKWRITARMEGPKYHSQQFEVLAGTPLTFTCPAAGKLEYLILYLYDRTDKTPREVGTPMDIYREAILGEARP